MCEYVVMAPHRLPIVYSIETAFTTLVHSQRLGDLSVHSRNRKYYFPLSLDETCVNNEYK